MMLEPRKLLNAGRNLQTESEQGLIQFRSGDFYLGCEEVTGQTFIADLEHLSLSCAIRSKGKVVSVLPREPFWDFVKTTENAADFWTRVTAASPDADNRLIVSLTLEHCQSGILSDFLADTAEGHAAVGALCNVCARHPLDGRPIVTLVSWKHIDASGTVARLPKFHLVDWERRCPSYADDDIPF